MVKAVNREHWLELAVTKLDAKFFKSQGKDLPEKVHVSCGMPKGNTAIGECWSKEATEDGAVQIFISPTLDEEARIIDVLLHELGHALLGHEEGHGKLFRAFMKDVGLTGKPTATVVEEGSELHITIIKLVKVLGPYPNSTMTMRRQPGKKKGTTWTLLQSPHNPKYRVQISPLILDEHGYPDDPWGNQMEVVEKK